MQSEHKKFPVLDDNWRGKAKFVKWDLLNEDQAMTNHKHTLEELAKGGGLYWSELYWNYYKLPLNTHQNESQMMRMMEALLC